MTHQHDNSKQKLVARYSSAAVLGLGVTGYSVVRYLSARGLTVTVMDTRQEPPLASMLAKHYPDVETHFGNRAFEHLANAGLIVVSPGIALSKPELQHAKQSGAEIVGDIELFMQENKRPVIAITGSNGKSTVTQLVGEMCSASGMTPLVAGNIGLPALDALTDNIDYSLAVLELSSFQLETTSRVFADSAAILNVSADHMDRYETMGHYILAKARIFRGAQVAVIPRHDSDIRQVTNIRHTLTFDLDEPANDSEFGVVRASKQRWLAKGDKRLIKLRDIPLTGLHNVKNVLAAFALVDGFKFPLESLVSAIKRFSGLPHRMQTVAQVDDVTWVNDSKATNIGATSTALLNLENSIIWIAGGQGKGADFNDLRAAVTSNIKLLILIGEDADQIETALSGLLSIERAGSLQEAVKKAGAAAQANDVVLLSPACASFDMFQSFEHRGDEFSKAVRNYITGDAA